MPAKQSQKVLRKDGKVRKDVRTAFTSTHPEEFKDPNPKLSTEAKSKRMRGEHVRGVGVFTTNTGLPVKTDIRQFVEEMSKLSNDVRSDLDGILGRMDNSGRVSTYAYRQLQDKMRALNAANQRLGLLIKDQDDPPKKAKKK